MSFSMPQWTECPPSVFGRGGSNPVHDKSIFLSRVEGQGFHVEGEGTMSRVEGNIFFPIFFFLEKVMIDAINVTNK